MSRQLDGRRAAQTPPAFGKHFFFENLECETHLVRTESRFDFFYIYMVVGHFYWNLIGVKNSNQVSVTWQIKKFHGVKLT